MGTDATQIKTYNNVIDTIKCVAESHLQINAVTTGDIYDIDLAKHTIFPLCHINPINTIVSKNQLTMNFQIFIMDLVQVNKYNTNTTNMNQNIPVDNEQEVLSDTQQIAVDIISIFLHSATLQSSGNDYNGRMITGGDFTLEPFVERFDNSLAGYVFTLPVEVMNQNQSCYIPFEADKICIK
tara:strand:+ start:2707 stop:3252 length:546 start_codon:yes stop_codon:yes gene_type:complete